MNDIDRLNFHFIKQFEIIFDLMKVKTGRTRIFLFREGVGEFL